MKVTETKIGGAYLIDLDIFSDERGFFLESYQHQRYVKYGLDVNFVQDNRSFSKKEVVRGLHYQVNHPIGHLIYVIHGSVFDVGVDLRVNSPSFGKYFSIVLTAEKNQQLFLPAGIAHGYCTLAEENEILYKCTEYYDPADEAGVLWNDPDIGIKWPISEPVIGKRDSNFPLLKEIKSSQLPKV